MKTLSQSTSACGSPPIPASEPEFVLDTQGARATVGHIEDDNNLYVYPADYSNPEISKASTGLRDPSNIIRVGNLYYVYFTHVPNTEATYPNGYEGTIYYASSPDLRTWTVGSEVIAKGTGSDFDANGCFTPGVMVDGGRVYLTYDGVGSDFNYPTFVGAETGMAVADSPTGPFTKLGVVIQSGGSGAWDISVGDSDPIKIGDEYRIYYSGAAVAGQKKLGYAHATNPEGPYTKYASNPVLTVSGSYNGLEASSIFPRDGQYHLFGDGFNGGASTEDLLHFKSSDGITWTADSTPIVVAATELGSTANVYAPGFYSANGNVVAMIYHSSASDPSLSMATIGPKTVEIRAANGLEITGVTGEFKGIFLDGDPNSAVSNLRIILRNNKGPTGRRAFCINAHATVGLGILALNDDLTFKETLVSWDSSGNMNVAGGDVYVAGTKVVGARATGWAAPTGTSTRSTFATSTVTTEQLAERVKAMYEDLKAHGLVD